MAVAFSSSDELRRRTPSFTWQERFGRAMKRRRPLTLVIAPLLLAVLNVCGGSSSSTPMQSSVPALAIATVPVGVVPVAVGVNSATNRIYVANRGDGVSPGNVMAIDGGTNAVTFTATAGVGPSGIAVNSLTNKIYVTNSYEDSVTVIDAATNNTQTISLTVGSFPCAVAVDTTTNMVYVVNYGGTVTVIDGITNNPTTVPVAVGASNIAINSATNKIYVSNSTRSGVGTLTVIDGATNATSAAPLDGLISATFDVALNSLTNKVYVSGGGIVSAIDGTTLVTNTIHAGGSAGVIAVDVNTNKVYVGDNTTSPNSVTVVDGTTMSTLTVPTGQYPGVIAVDEAINQIYVLNRDSGTATVIDGASNSTSLLSVGLSPIAAALNPSTHRVYVVNQCGSDSKCSTNGTLTVIDGPH